MRLFYGGPILTMHREEPNAEALAIKGEKILAVGDLDAVRAAAPGAEEINLSGTCLLPGFIDAHQHFSLGAFFHTGPSLHWPRVKSVKDILKLIENKAADTPAGEWIIAEGYDELHLREHRGPTLKEIDEICPNHPVLVLQYSFHEGIVNSFAHEVLGLPLRRPDPPCGEICRDKQGLPTGLMIENALTPFFMLGLKESITSDMEAFISKFERYQERHFSVGITRIYDAAVSPEMEQLFRDTEEQGIFRLPVTIMLSGAEGLFIPPWDRINGEVTGAGTDPIRIGPLKLFMEGGEQAAISFPVRTAMAVSFSMIRRILKRRTIPGLRYFAKQQMRFDWSRRKFCGGKFLYEKAEMRKIIEKATDRGFSIAVHAVGNDAIDRALELIPPTPAKRETGVWPHRIEHFFLPNADAIKRAADSGIASAVQPSILELTGQRLLDTGTIGQILFSPYRDMIDAGMIVAGSSDAPVVDFDPLKGIRAAVRRVTAEGEPLNDGQNVTIQEALEMFTVNAARAGGLEKEVGTLEPGKRADIVTLNEDPTKLSSGDLDRLKVIRTICGGMDAYVQDI
jgi:predicted amidohydrolase YtcJ